MPFEPAINILSSFLISLHINQITISFYLLSSFNPFFIRSTSFLASFKSNSIIDFINFSKEILGDHPNFSLAFAASPNNVSTSHGLKYLESILTIISPVSDLFPTSFKPSPSQIIALEFRLFHPNSSALISRNSLTLACLLSLLHNHLARLVGALTTAFLCNLQHDPNL